MASSNNNNDKNVAIVGMACNFPGAPTVDKFWELLDAGRCSVGPVPSARPFLIRNGSGSGSGSGSGATAAVQQQQHAATGMTPTAGAFVDGVEWFDAELFGVSPQEARYLDPQQVRDLREGCEKTSGVRL